MDSLNEAKQLISQSQNICLIPFSSSQISQNETWKDKNEPESLTAALALFYTLKELNKNVNLIVDNFPEKLNFLVPSPDFITSPKNFVISIPRDLADVSQIYYEKNEENLKIHLTVNKGNVKKEGISFYFSDAKPDLTITLGIKDLQGQLSDQLDFFDFLLDVPILNIDTLATLSADGEENKKFGKVNVIKEKSICEIVLETIKSIDENLVNKDVANCLLTGLTIYYENFKKRNTSPEVLQIVAELVKRGALQYQIHDNLQKMTKKEIDFFSNIFRNLKTIDNYEVSFAMLNSNEFQSFGKNEADFTVEKIKTIGIQNDMLVLWKGHSSDPTIKGFFYSRKPDLINRVSKSQRSFASQDWVFLSMPGTDINSAKELIIKLL